MKQHHVALDGLRGVAALAVAVGHMGHETGHPLDMSFHLAVDLFFGLSGFIVATAYEQRLKAGLSPFAFAKIRFVRLYPLYLLSVLVALAYVLFKALLKPPILM